MDSQMLLSGPIKKSLLLFMVPLFFSMLFQSLYNIVDTVLIGYFLGDASLAAIGSVTPVFDLIVGFCTGFGQGMGIVAGQCFGSGRMDRLKQCVALSIVLCALVSLGISALSLAGLGPLLQLLETPAQILGQAYSYIRLIALGLLITMFYNLSAGMLRSIGDSMTPLYVLMISCVINVILDIFCITVLHLGVAGAAVATLAAQALSLVICLIWIARKKQILVPGRQDFAWDGQLAAELCSQGFAMALMNSIVSLGTVILQKGLNPLGTEYIAAQSAARKVTGICTMLVACMMMALSAFVAQNTGAGQYERVARGVAFANRFGLYYSLIITVFFLFASRFMIHLISNTTNPLILDNGSMYILTNVPFDFLLALVLNLRCSLQSMSIKAVPVFSSVVECVGKILFTWFVVPVTGYLGVCLCEPVIWFLMFLPLWFCWKRVPQFQEQGIQAGIYRTKRKA